jgi:hypothetical protein
MHHIQDLRPVGLQIHLTHGMFPRGHSHPDRRAQGHHRDSQFVTLLNAFRRSGGLVRTPEVAARIANRGAGANSPLAGWLVKRQVICIEWQETLWLPLFQFDASGLALKVGLAAALSELVRDHDDWAVASWFAQPNPWLAHGTPADSLSTMAPQVLTAARWERNFGATSVVSQRSS